MFIVNHLIKRLSSVGATCKRGEVSPERVAPSGAFTFLVSRCYKHDAPPELRVFSKIHNCKYACPKRLPMRGTQAGLRLDFCIHKTTMSTAIAPLKSEPILL